MCSLGLVVLHSLVADRRTAGGVVTLAVFTGSTGRHGGVGEREIKSEL